MRQCEIFLFVSDGGAVGGMDLYHGFNHNYWRRSSVGQYQDYHDDEPRPDPAVTNHLTNNDHFISSAKVCREFLSTFFAGTVLDSLSESARQVNTHL